MSARSIKTSELRTADILVSTGRSFISGAIRVATGTDFSHTILYLGDNKVVEAISDGVVERDLSAPLGEANLVIALRRRHMDTATKESVVRFARGFKGRPYDYLGAAGAGLSHNRGKMAVFVSPAGTAALYVAAKINASDAYKDDKFFCSELAARCFELSGVPINDGDPSFTTPRAVRVAKNLIYVGHLVGGP
jgi:hypothetical protein